MEAGGNLVVVCEKYHNLNQAAFRIKQAESAKSKTRIYNRAGAE
jgi:hypothetical protein